MRLVCKYSSCNDPQTLNRVPHLFLLHPLLPNNSHFSPTFLGLLSRSRARSRSHALRTSSSSSSAAAAAAAYSSSFMHCELTTEGSKAALCSLSLPPSRESRTAISGLRSADEQRSVFMQYTLQLHGRRCCRRRCRWRRRRRRCHRLIGATF